MVSYAGTRRGRSALLGLFVLVLAATVWTTIIPQPQPQPQPQSPSIDKIDVATAELQSESEWAKKRATQANDDAAKKAAWAANKAEVDRLLAETKGKLSALEARLGEGYADCAVEGEQCQCTGQVWPSYAAPRTRMPT
jgi:predicted Zn-dependent protease